MLTLQALSRSLNAGAAKGLPGLRRGFCAPERPCPFTHYRGRRAKPGRFGSLAFAKKNRSWVCCLPRAVDECAGVSGVESKLDRCILRHNKR